MKNKLNIIIRYNSKLVFFNYAKEYIDDKDLVDSPCNTYEMINIRGYSAEDAAPICNPAID